MTLTSFLPHTGNNRTDEASIRVESDFFSAKLLQVMSQDGRGRALQLDQGERTGQDPAHPCLPAVPGVRKAQEQ